MKCEYPADGQILQLRQLWQLAFGDSDSALDQFFCTAYSPRRCRCITIDGQVAAALYWFDASYDGQKYAYLYAVATHPAFRSRGLCRKLMESTHALLAKHGYAGVLLKPNGEALRTMYAKMGYRDCSTVSEFACAACGTPADIRLICKAEYGRLRRTFLPPGSVIQEAENLDYLAAYARLYTGKGFLLAATAEGETLQGIELLGSASAAPGILTALGYARGCFRTPGTDIPFAMFCPLRADARSPAYFGLAFD